MIGMKVITGGMMMVKKIFKWFIANEVTNLKQQYINEVAKWQN